MILPRVLLMLMVAAVAGTAIAQPCPQGIPQGAPGCVPPNHPNLPSNANQSSEPVRASWRKTWGALAADPDSTWIGSSTGHISRRAAAKEAVDKCKAKGGRSCEVMLAYENQCAVIAIPAGYGGPMQVIYQSGPTIERAGQIAFPQCAAQNGGRQCELMYTNCTAPVLVK
jgi:hypothetical protein